MKPAGPMPAGFSDSGGVLRVGGRTASELIADAGDTPLFVYDRGAVDRKIASFREAFGGGLALHYAMKANPYAPLLEHIVGLVDGIDVASAGELKLALAAGAKPEHISYAGPGKRDDDLAEAIAAGVTLNCESEGEAERALKFAENAGKRLRIALRVNPSFDIKGSGMRMGGGAKPFGIDAERVPALVGRLLETNADWRGFHIFAGSQTLNAQAVIEAQAQTLALAGRLADLAGACPPLVNLGGGLGIPYFANDAAIDLRSVASSLVRNLKDRPQSLANTDFALELGRWLVGEAGVYFCRVVDRKLSHCKLFLVTDGGIQHQLAASGNFGQVIRRNFPVANATRWGQPASEAATVVGCSCTPLDILADDVVLPRTEIGDVIAVFMAGAYGLTASPQAFLTQRPAHEIMV